MAVVNLPWEARRQLLEWFERFGRPLPWRRAETDPYGVLVSEFMLQQTTVGTVVPYFERWMRRFPDIEALASASEEDVLSAWQGLGYYSRARRLHLTAKALCRQGGVRWPASFGEWTRLPGVGEYTAAAVEAFAFNRPAPVVDANVARVLARWGGYRQPLESSGGRRWLRRVALELQPEEGSGLVRAWNSAVMELGATVCRAKRTECLICPVKAWCAAFCSGEDTTLLPVKRRRPQVTAVEEHRVLRLSEDGLYFWAEVSAGPRWAGLHVLPLCRGACGGPVLEMSYFITRYRVRMRVFVERGDDGDSEAGGWCRPNVGGVAGSCGLRRIAVSEWESLAWASPHRRAVARVLALLHTSHTDAIDTRA